MDAFTRGVAALIFVTLAAGCATKNPGSAAFETPGVEARLVGANSAASGNIRFFDRGNGVAVQLSLFNLLPGTYLITLHERGNCRSSNLFSAGPAWSPPGSGLEPGKVLPPFDTNTDGDIPNYNAFIPGVRTDGPNSLRGRVVVIQFGRGVSDAEPGLPNKRMACGILDTVRALF